MTLMKVTNGNLFSVQVQHHLYNVTWAQHDNKIIFLIKRAPAIMSCNVTVKVKQFLHAGLSENLTLLNMQTVQNCPVMSVHSNENPHTVWRIDSSGFWNCICLTGTIILMSRLMSHKSDRVPCCLSLLVVKIKTKEKKNNCMCGHDLCDGNNFGIKEYQSITLLHICIMFACPDQLPIYTSCSAYWTCRCL